jgi:hypothetical protein
MPVNVKLGKFDRLLIYLYPFSWDSVEKVRSLRGRVNTTKTNNFSQAAIQPANLFDKAIMERELRMRGYGSMIIKVKINEPLAIRGFGVAQSIV